MLDLVNIMQVGLDLRNATGAQNLLSKFTQPKRAQYTNFAEEKEVIRNRVRAEAIRLIAAMEDLGRE